YLLSKEEINQDIDSMVDGVHPNDIGMMKYADAYEKRLREIFNEPVKEISTPVSITR
ncbi:SGNH/GDSL hydrolase family protein, partial [Gelidibacter sp.]|uniref:SGNH/GDSL hydrolase family protein n=1 Tax=Gelidibacter sp. TaxID=2018083 RepID=UPI0039C8798E